MHDPIERPVSKCVEWSVKTTPKGIRIPVTSVKGKCPRPLDDGGIYERLCGIVHALLQEFYNEELTSVNQNVQMKEAYVKSLYRPRRIGRN